MKLSFTLNDTQYHIDSTKPYDISIPLNFNGAQPNSYGVPSAEAQAFEGGGFVGDVRRGGSCNFESYTFIPHCNGTHTECIGHITAARIAVHERLQDSFIPATLVEITPILGVDSGESYQPSFGAKDLIISASALNAALQNVAKDFLSALIIRTTPNPESKKSWQYPDTVEPPFFSIEAMQLIHNLGVQHLLIDIPSVDRLMDEGKLSAHHIFWNLPAGGQEDLHHSLQTITEFIYVPNEIPVGSYLLNLQIAAFMSDASPSRPRIFAVNRD